MSMHVSMSVHVYASVCCINNLRQSFAANPTCEHGAWLEAQTCIPARATHAIDAQSELRLGER
jgi:hypothetical protein